MEEQMNTETAVFYERRKSILPIDFSDRRRTQRRSNGSFASLERRRLTSQIRQHERETIHIPVRLHIECKEILGQTQNISAGGLLILINSLLTTGTPITLQFSFGESVCYLSIVGQVVFCCLERNNGSDQYRMGIKFSAIHDFDQKILDTAIQTLKQKAASQVKSSVRIIVAKDILAKETVNLISKHTTTNFTGTTTKNVGLQNTTTFQRRKHIRYAIVLEATVSWTAEDGEKYKSLSTVNNLSRYGVCFKMNSNVINEDSNLQLQLTFPNGHIAAVGVKVLRREISYDKSFSYAGEMSFPWEDSRRKVHTFLRAISSDNITERRNGERRQIPFRPELERRKTDRRRNFGIFADCVSFASRAPSRTTTYTLFRHTEATLPGRIFIRGKQLISYGSNDYLGLSHDPRVKEAAIKALEKYGTGTGSRVLNGTLSIHSEFECELAEFKGTETALVFAGGYLANVAILTALLKKDDAVFLDEKAHASIIDGCIYSGANIIPFRHNDVKDLENKIRRKKQNRSIIIVDGVYSIEGDLALLPQIREVAMTCQIPLMVDDAHGFGVMGPTGAGTPEHFGLNGKIDIDMGTLSGALGAIGGFLACHKYIAEYLKEFSRGFRYTTSLPPSITAGLLEALKIIKTDSSLRAKLWSNMNRLKTGLRAMGYQISPTESTIMSIPIGNEQTTYEIVRMLEAHDIYVSPFMRPAVKRGEARIRLTVSAAHSEQDISRTLEVFNTIKPEVQSKTEALWIA
jgi:8-amino-7-oxononanoate synthase